MNDLLIIGTDTGAGKTTFALLWMTAFAGDYAYWKPLETGERDSGTIQRLGAGGIVHLSLMSFRPPVGPLLAARQEGLSIPSSHHIAASRPRSVRPLLIESFGGPLSPLNEDELQIELI